MPDCAVAAALVSFLVSRVGLTHESGDATRTAASPSFNKLVDYLKPRAYIQPYG